MFRRFIVLASTALITGAAGRLREHRLLGGGTRRVRLARAVRRRRQQQLRRGRRRRRAAAGVDAIGQGRLWRPRLRSGSGSYLAVNAQTSGGCSLMVWEADNNARQRWCTRLLQGGGLSSPLLDGFDNLYIGQPGPMLSFPPTQWFRWRQPVIGMPTTARILADGHLLVVTHLGQVLRLRRPPRHRRWARRWIWWAASTRPIPNAGWPTARAGAAPLPGGGRARVRSLDGDGGARLWEPGADAPVLVGLRYQPGQSPLLTREWTSDAVGGDRWPARCCPPTGRRCTSTGATNELWALNSADGKPKWSVPLDYLAQTPPSVSPDGLIVAGGGPGAKLVAVRDAGDRGEVVWTRDDVAPVDHVEPGGRRRRLHRRHATARTGRRCWCSTPPTGTRSTAIRCPRRRGGRSGCRSATTAAWSPRPATARCTASRPTRSHPVAPAPRAVVRTAAPYARIGAMRVDRGLSRRRFRQQLALAEEEDQRVVGQREVLVVRRIEAVAGRYRASSPVCFCSSL